VFWAEEKGSQKIQLPNLLDEDRWESQWLTHKRRPPGNAQPMARHRADGSPTTVVAKIEKGPIFNEPVNWLSKDSNGQSLSAV
jgi:hypothetical protein